MKKNILLVFGVVVLLAGFGSTLPGGLVWAAPSISVTPENYNAGDLTRSPSTVYKVFQVFNSGDGILSIAKIKYT